MKFKKIISRLKSRLFRENTIVNNSRHTFRNDILGKGNCVTIGRRCKLNRCTIRIRGNNNTLTIEDNCYIGPLCSFWIEGNNSYIHIGKNCTFTLRIHINVQEDNMHIRMGEDCMLSNTIVIRTSDSHPIYNAEGIRLNYPKPVTIGDHVWIAPDTKIMKGAEIGDGCIIGSNSMVNSKIPANTIAVGTPAKVIRHDIKWTRETLF